MMAKIVKGSGGRGIVDYILDKCAHMGLLHLDNVVASSQSVVHPARCIVDVEVVDLLGCEESAEHLAVAQLEVLAKDESHIGVACYATAILCTALLEETLLVGHNLRYEVRSLV